MLVQRLTHVAECLSIAGPDAFPALIAATVDGNGERVPRSVQMVQAIADCVRQHQSLGPGHSTLMRGIA